VRQGVEEGAEIFQPSWSCPKDGWFYPPTLLSNVSPASTVAQVEIFGPVLAAMTFRTPKEAVDIANNTTYGLAASVWTENVNLAHDVASKLKAGTLRRCLRLRRLPRKRLRPRRRPRGLDRVCETLRGFGRQSSGEGG
jgi:acyl-CoA reductase-like NAD-dependent aldehyde dehydrogenase